jgi:putative heme-binding domain-containing protein
MSLSTNEDPRPRPVPLHRFVLPWADPHAKSDAPPEAIVRNFPELAGGSWGRGRLVFRSEAAGCFKCHTLLGDTGKIGPDLHGLVQRDYASVMRDLINPSFAINPDHIGHAISLKDGRILTGVLRTEGGELLLGDEKGNTTKIKKDDIDEMKPAEASIMPKGLLDKLSKEQVRDLLTYLLMPPPKMPLDSPLPAPPIRTQAEVAASLAGAPKHEGAYRFMNIVLVAGEKDHGPGEHDYPAWQRAWLELLTADPTLTVSTAWEFPDDEQLKVADVLVFFQKGSFKGDRPAKLDAYLKRGGGAVYLHWAVNADEQVREFAERIGMASGAPAIAFRHGPLTLDMHNTDHPILRNFRKLELYDESYWKMAGDPSKFTLLATSTEDNQPTPQMWVVDHDPGRVFVAIPGHYNWTFDDPLFRIILLRGIAWTAREPVDRFNDLVPLGARLSR